LNRKRLTSNLNHIAEIYIEGEEVANRTRKSRIRRKRGTRVRRAAVVALRVPSPIAAPHGWEDGRRLPGRLSRPGRCGEQGRIQAGAALRGGAMPGRRAGEDPGWGGAR
jgi:hypothetical protein